MLKEPGIKRQDMSVLLVLSEYFGLLVPAQYVLIRNRGSAQQRCRLGPNRWVCANAVVVRRKSYDISFIDRFFIGQKCY
jgi:hypothetical protein